MGKKMGVGRRLAVRARKAGRAAGSFAKLKHMQHQSQAQRNRHDIVVVSGAAPGGERATSGSAFHDVLTSNPNPVSAGLYRRGQHILLVGEGDFSFSLALATAIGGDTLVATSYDKQAEVITKYRCACVPRDALRVVLGGGDGDSGGVGDGDGDSDSGGVDVRLWSWRCCFWSCRCLLDFRDILPSV